MLKTLSSLPPFSKAKLPFTTLPLNAFPLALTLPQALLSLAVNANNADDTSPNENGVALDTVTVTYQQAYRGNTAPEALPQSMDVLDSSLLDGPVTDLQTALSYSPSVSRQNSLGGLWDSFAVRGFPGNENMPSGYLINGFSGGRGFSGRRDISAIDYIEIQKGPGSALYGRGEPGGTINIITKKPQFLPAGSITLEGGSYDHKRLEGDYTRGINDELAFRVTGALQDSDSFRDEVFQRREVLNPSLLFTPSDDTKVLYEGEYLNHEQLFDRGIVVLDNDFDTVPRSRYLGEPGDGATEVRAIGHQLSLEQQLNSEWRMSLGYSNRRSWLDGFSSDTELSPSRQSLYDDGETLTRQRRLRDYQTADHSFRAELSGSAMTGNIEHNLLLGADGYRYRLDQNLDRYRGGNGTYTLNIFAPEYGQDQPEVAPLNRNHELQHGYGFYLQDLMTLTDDLRVLIGARFDQYWQSLHEKVYGAPQSDSGNVTSPRVGVTYDLTDELTTYASHSRGFLPLTGSDADGNGFDPERSRASEVGVRYSDAGWYASLAYFQATKSNVLTADPVNAGFSTQLGEAKSDGVEVEASDQLSAQTSLRVSYTWLDSRTSKDAVNPDWGVEIPAGSALVNIPEHSANLMLQHHLMIRNIPSHAALTVNYVGERLGDTVDPDYILPEHWLVDVSAGVEVLPDLTVEAAVTNLTDTFWVDNSYSALWTRPGAPRTYKASLTYEF